MFLFLPLPPPPPYHNKCYCFLLPSLFFFLLVQIGGGEGEAEHSFLTLSPFFRFHPFSPLSFSLPSLFLPYYIVVLILYNNSCVWCPHNDQYLLLRSSYNLLPDLSFILILFLFFFWIACNVFKTCDSCTSGYNNSCAWCPHDGQCLSIGDEPNCHLPLHNHCRGTFSLSVWLFFFSFWLFPFFFLVLF